MSKISIVIDALKPYADKAATALSHGAKAAVDLVKNRDFQKGAAAVLIPSGVSAFFLIRKYQKEADEKESLYKEKLKKHNAIIEELAAKADIDQERQDRLLQYDSKLKAEMGSLEKEIEQLKKQIDELKKDEKNEEV